MITSAPIAESGINCPKFTVAATKGANRNQNRPHIVQEYTAPLFLLILTSSAVHVNNTAKQHDMLALDIIAVNIRKATRLDPVTSTGIHQAEKAAKPANTLNSPVQSHFLFVNIMKNSPVKAPIISDNPAITVLISMCSRPKAVILTRAA